MNSNFIFIMVFKLIFYAVKYNNYYNINNIDGDVNVFIRNYKQYNRENTHGSLLYRFYNIVILGD